MPSDVSVLRQPAVDGRISHHSVRIMNHLDAWKSWILPFPVLNDDMLWVEPSAVQDYPYRCFDTVLRSDGERHRLMYEYEPPRRTPIVVPWKWPDSNPPEFTIKEIMTRSDFTPNTSDIGPINDDYFRIKEEMDRHLEQVADQHYPADAEEAEISHPFPPSSDPALEPDQHPLVPISTIREYLDQESADPAVLWWLQTAFNEAQATIKKAREYGSAELIYAGHVMNAIHEGRTLAFGEGSGRRITDPYAAETQIYHYCLGKMGRWTAAMTRGEPVSFDTIYDLGIYVRMVQRLRETGEWP